MKRFLLLGLIGCAMLLSTRASALDVAASIKPVHSLVAGVMKGVGTPRLIVGSNASPHDYHLKPSDAQALQNADAIFWIGPSLETFLESPLKSLGHKARIVALYKAEGLHMIGEEDSHDLHDDHEENAKHEEHDDHDDGHEEHDDHAGEHDGHDHSGPDMHLWLDPINAKAMVHHIATVLQDIDPVNAKTYQQNAESIEKRLDQLSTEVHERLHPLEGRPFVVFHDAYDHFAHRFHLNVVAEVTLSPERKPGAKRLSEVRHTIAETKAVCVFSEPQFRPKLVETVIEGSSARSGVLDPLGANIQPGPDMYFTLINNLAQSLEDCLTR